MALRTSHIMVLAAAVVAAAGCSTAGGEPMPTPATSNATPPAAVAPVDPVVEQADFDTWLANFRIEARAAGISAGTVDRSLTGLRILPDVLTADGSQPEFVRPVWSYLDGALNEARINRGREQLNTQRALLGGVSRDYGVPPETIVAIWAMESNFGSNIGSYNVIEALATLAWHGRRAAFAREQLLAALKIIDQGDAAAAPPDRLLGRRHGADAVHADHFRRPCGGPGRRRPARSLDQPAGRFRLDRRLSARRGLAGGGALGGGSRPARRFRL